MQALATASGISFQQIKKYEVARNQVCASRLWALSKALRCPIAYFFDNRDSVAVSSKECDPALAESIRGFLGKGGACNLRAGLRFAWLYGRIDRADVRQQVLDLTTMLADG